MEINKDTTGKTRRALNPGVWQNEEMILAVFCQTSPVFKALSRIQRLSPCYLT